MYVRFFGSSECRDCLELFVILEKSNVEYEHVDALDYNDDDIQNLCDEYDVDKLPHIQFIENEEVIIEHKGPVDEEEFTQYLISYFPEY